MPGNKNNYDDLDCFTIEEISKIVKLSESACYRWCQDNVIPNIKFTKGCVRIPRREFLIYWRENINMPEGIELDKAINEIKANFEERR